MIFFIKFINLWSFTRIHSDKILLMLMIKCITVAIAEKPNAYENSMSVQQIMAEINVIQNQL